MESHGEADRIHLAPSTAALLESSGVFEVVSRGEIVVKGKGSVETAWLIGRRDIAAGTLPCGDETTRSAGNTEVEGPLSIPCQLPCCVAQAQGASSMAHVESGSSTQRLSGRPSAGCDSTGISSTCCVSLDAVADGDGLRLRRQQPGRTHVVGHHADDDWEGLVALMRGDSDDGGSASGREKCDLRLFRD